MESYIESNIVAILTQLNINYSSKFIEGGIINFTGKYLIKSCYNLQDQIFSLIFNIYNDGIKRVSNISVIKTKENNYTILFIGY